jgi:valyl-tRNA synthetase
VAQDIITNLFSKLQFVFYKEYTPKSQISSTMFNNRILRDRPKMNQEPRIEQKRWNSSNEQKVRQKWEIIDTNNNQNNRQLMPFVIDTPPPYPSGRPWHIGAAAHYAQIDMIARTARMSGFNVLFPIGIDRNGLPIEIYTEKKYKISMKKTDRRKFLELCKNALDELEQEMIEIMKLIGLSADFKNYYRTDSSKFRALTQSTFIELWNRGMIYIANRPNNFCPDCGTTIADAEIIYEEVSTKLVYMKFRIKDESSNVIVASTRPELLFACQAVIVNPKDKRYENIVGKRLILPLFNKEVPVYAHHSARPEFGTGAVMVCSYGDQNDILLFRELGLKEIAATDVSGRTTTAAESYAKLPIQEARARIISDLKTRDFLEKTENIMHRTPLCERSRTPVEIIPLQDYYLKQIEYIPELKQLAGQLKFYPEIHRQILMNWLDSVATDWPISRRRYYGTEIPIWYCLNCQYPNLPPPGKYYRPWEEQPPFDKCANCDGRKFIGEDRTFDTWMDSSLTTLYIGKYGGDGTVQNNLYPSSIRPQAKDIIRTWLYYSMLRCVQLTNKLPWSKAWIMGFGVDERGEKMSKSKGNVMDPMPIIQRYGADAFRFWSASESSLGQDFRCSEQKIAVAKNFLSKLWNVARFVSSFDSISEKPHTIAPSDKWMLGELQRLVEECKKGYSEFNFFIPANAIREFTWNVFAAHYIEMVKWRAYLEESSDLRRSTIYTLHKCMTTILTLLAPICPYITEEIWTTMYSRESIHLRRLPEIMEDYHDYSSYTTSIMNFNSMVWNKKKSYRSPETGKSLSLKDPIDLTVPKDLSLFEEDLKMMHNIKR